jgi:hypothetical protein
VALVGAVGWLLHFRAAAPAEVAVERARPPADAPSRSEVDSIRGLLGRYDQGLGDLGQVQWQQTERIAALEKRLAEALGAQAGQESPPAAPEQPDPAQLEAQAREQFARSVQLAREEGIDASWSEHAERQLGDAFRGEKLAGSALQRVECRSTLCFAEVLHDDESAHDAFVSGFPALVDWAFDARLEVDREHGKPSTRMLITREGAALPQ